MVATTPFATPWLAVSDTLRVLCAVIGGLNALMLVRIAVNISRRQIILPTRWGTYAMAFLTVAAVFTEIGRMGTPMTWRLPMNLAGVTTGVVYSWRLLHLYPKEQWGGAAGTNPWV